MSPRVCPDRSALLRAGRAHAPGPARCAARAPQPRDVPGSPRRAEGGRGAAPRAEEGPGTGRRRRDRAGQRPPSGGGVGGRSARAGRAAPPALAHLERTRTGSRTPPAPAAESPRPPPRRDPHPPRPAPLRRPGSPRPLAAPAAAEEKTRRAGGRGARTEPSPRERGGLRAADVPPPRGQPPGRAAGPGPARGAQPYPPAPSAPAAALRRSPSCCALGRAARRAERLQRRPPGEGGGFPLPPPAAASRHAAPPAGRGAPKGGGGGSCSRRPSAPRRPLGSARSGPVRPGRPVGPARSDRAGCRGTRCRFRPGGGGGGEQPPGPALPDGRRRRRGPPCRPRRRGGEDPSAASLPPPARAAERLRGQRCEGLPPARRFPAVLAEGRVPLPSRERAGLGRSRGEGARRTARRRFSLSRRSRHRRARGEAQDRLGSNSRGGLDGPRAPAAEPAAPWGSVPGPGPAPRRRTAHRAVQRRAPVLGHLGQTTSSHLPGTHWSHRVCQGFLSSRSRRCPLTHSSVPWSGTELGAATAAVCLGGRRVPNTVLAKCSLSSSQGQMQGFQMRTVLEGTLRAFGELGSSAPHHREKIKLSKANVGSSDACIEQSHLERTERCKTACRKALTCRRKCKQ